MKLFMMKIHLFRTLKFCIQNSLEIFLFSVGMSVSIVSVEDLLGETVGSVFSYCVSFDGLLKVVVLIQEAKSCICMCTYTSVPIYKTFKSERMTRCKSWSMSKVYALSKVFFLLWKITQK